MMSKRINFHQTFPPTAEFITRLMEVCDTGNALTKEELSEMTGIPTGKSSGKVEPHICYAEYMGLIKDDCKGGKHDLTLTSLGKELLRQDPGMQEKVSTAVCHSRISSLYGGAYLWSAMFKDIFPRYTRGIGDAELKEETEKLIGQPAKMGPFFSSYSGMFGNLGLISKKESKYELLQGTADKELIYSYAYALIYEWENKFPGQTEVTSMELDSLRIAETFGMSEKTYYSILEMLAERDIVHFNRQLMPYTLYRTHNAEDIIPLLYSELC